jgi:hypothetical protein
MNVMKKFKIEYGGFKESITSYTSEANNILTQLDKGVKSGDKEAIMYVGVVLAKRGKYMLRQL